MPNVAGAAIHPQALLGFERSLDEALRPVVERLKGIIVSHATVRERQDDELVRIVPAKNEKRLLNQTGVVLQRFFVGPDLRHAFADDGVTALSPYADLLNFWNVWLTYRVVEKHEQAMRRRLKKHPDIIRYLESARFPAREQLDPIHTWLDRRGFQLSDRIWQNSLQARMKMDLLLKDAIRTRRSAFDLARDLEPFLLPSQKGLTTTKPYGRKASFPALRLGRSEIGRWHTSVTLDSGRANPFVEGMDWALSSRHPRIDICDDFATIDMRGERIRDPYPLTARRDPPLPIIDSHPQCICTARSFVGSNSRDVVEELRTQMFRRQPAPVTPIVRPEFIILLLGPILARLFGREVSDATA